MGTKHETGSQHPSSMCSAPSLAAHSLPRPREPEVSFSLLISCRSKNVSKESPRMPRREHPKLSSQQLAADCLTHLQLVKMDNTWLKATLIHPEPICGICVARWSANWSPFHCRSRSSGNADAVRGVSSFDTAVPGTSVTRCLTRGGGGATAFDGFFLIVGSISPAALCGMLEDTIL